MTTVKEINHDSGPPIGNHYGSVTDTDGAITVNIASALDGSAYGIDMDFSAGAATVILVETFAFSAAELRMRFRIDLSNVSHAGAASNTIIMTLETSVGLVFELIIAYVSGVPSLRGSFRIDNNDIVVIATSKTLSTTTSCIEMRAIRETADGNTDGELEFYVDGVQAFAAVTNIDNFNKWNDGIDTIQVSIDSAASLSGNLYYDQWILDNDNAIGLGCGPILALASIPKPASIDASGTFIYMALLRNGTSILSKVSTVLNADGTVVFNPGAGTNIGVQCGKFDVNVVWVAGNFGGTDVVEKSENAGSSFSVKDPATFGNVTAFVVGPEDERVLLVDDTVDIQETIDDGANWTEKNSAIGFPVNALARFSLNLMRAVFGNASAVNDNIDYSPNSGVNLEDYSAGFPQSDITSIVVR